MQTKELLLVGRLISLKCLHCDCRQELPQPEPSMAALAVEGMSLDRFMAKHTSEDNASFAQIMEESNKRRRLSKPWLFEQKDKVCTPLPRMPPA